ncbi:putative Upstream stimulatory factor 1 protein, partial [Naja naja]
ATGEDPTSVAIASIQSAATFSDPNIKYVEDLKNKNLILRAQLRQHGVEPCCLAEHCCPPPRALPPTPPCMQPHVAPIQSFPYSHLWHRELQRSCVVMSPPLPGALLLPSEWGRSQQPLLLALSRPTFSPWMDSGRSPCVSALPKRRNVAGIAVQSAKDRSGSWVVTVFLSR